MGRFIFACFGSSSKCCSSSHISPTRQHQSQEATKSAVVDEQQPIQIQPHDESAEEELVENKVAIELNPTSDSQLNNLLPVNKKKSEEDEEEENEANYRELSTKHQPCSDDEKADESYNDFEVNVVEELESSESLFSLSIDSRKKHHHISAETEEVTSSSSRPPFSFPISGFIPGNEIKSSTTSSIEFNHSILKPIQNLSGWKTPVVTTPANSSPLKSSNNEEEDLEKENSLSSWLVDSESTSCKSVGNNDKKMMKMTKNSPDDETRTDTVASYWLHTGTSDSGFTSKKQQQADIDLSLRQSVPLSQLL